MLKILTAEQIKELDNVTIQKQGIKSVELMERAATEVANWIISHFKTVQPFKVFCGTGNNGGDGLAVARLLLKRSYKVQVYVLKSDKVTEDFKINEERLSSILTIHFIKNINEMPAITAGEIVIDAIFGSGLNRQTEGLYAEVIDAINNSDASVIAIDIASGLFADKTNHSKSII